LTTRTERTARGRKKTTGLCKRAKDRETCAGGAWKLAAKGKQKGETFKIKPLKGETEEDKLLLKSFALEGKDSFFPVDMNTPGKVKFS